MEITHNNKTYRWIGDKWGAYDLELYRMLIAKDWRNNDLVWLKENLEEYAGSICTFHTIPQLVKLGYLEEVKEEINLEEEFSKDFPNTWGDEELLEKVQGEYKWFKESEKKMLEQDGKQRELFYGEENKEYESFTLENITLPKWTTFEIKDGVKTIKLPDNSIIEKLREDLEKMEKSGEVGLDKSYQLWVYYVINYIRNFLTSSEQPKEEPQPQEDIELLDEFYHKTCSDLKMWLQVEILTNAVNKLIKANKK